MATETIAPKDKAFLSIKVVQESMDAHAKRMAIAFARWLSENEMEGSAEKLYDQFIESINK